MKNVLVVIQHIRRGGVELVAVNLSKNLNPDKYKVTYLLINPYEDQDNEFENELKNEGYEIIWMPQSAKGYIKKYRFIDELMKSRKFDIVHSHVILFSGLVLRAAKKNSIKVRASHSHTIRWNREENLKYKVYKFCMQKLLKKYSNLKFCCSIASGDFLYGKKVNRKSGIFLENGINTKQFSFNKDIRQKTRKEFFVSDKDILVGHVGTIYHIKNQAFLVEIFSEMLKKYPNAKLILVGQKVEIEPVIKKAEECNVLDKIIFTGERSDIQNIFQAMDIMIFPSLFEALPVSLIEAQASKLPCLISTNVTMDVKFNSNVEFLDLNVSAEKWAEKAISLLKEPRDTVNIDNLTRHYDINNVIGKLESYYDSLL